MTSIWPLYTRPSNHPSEYYKYCFSNVFTFCEFFWKSSLIQIHLTNMFQPFTQNVHLSIHPSSPSTLLILPHPSSSTHPSSPIHYRIIHPHPSTPHPSTLTGGVPICRGRGGSAVHQTRKIGTAIRGQAESTPGKPDSQGGLRAGGRKHLWKERKCHQIFRAPDQTPAGGNRLWRRNHHQNRTPREAAMDDKTCKGSIVPK